MRFVLFTLSAVLIVALVLQGCSEMFRPLRTGDPAPQGTLPDVQGKQVVIPDAYQGRLAVFLFWEKDCPYCASEMPALEQLYQNYSGKGLTIVAVNVGNTRDEVDRIARDKGITFPVLLDRERGISRMYGVIALPMMIFVSRDSRISRKILGGMDSAALEKIIDSALSE